MMVQECLDNFGRRKKLILLDDMNGKIGGK